MVSKEACEHTGRCRGPVRRALRGMRPEAGLSCCGAAGAGRVAAVVDVAGTAHEFEIIK
jgi:hypothetical protein